MSFKNKMVLITGAANGIGYCLAEEIAKRGANIILLDKQADKLEKVVFDLSSKYTDVDVYDYPIDLGSYTQLKTLVKSLKTRNLIPDVLINNAGIGHQGSLAKVKVTDWAKLINVNLRAPVYLSTMILDEMKKVGKIPCIVNVASGQAFFKLPTWGAYSTTKAALGTFSELLSIEEFGDAHILTVYPFMVDTGFYDGVKEQGGSWGSQMAMKLLPYYSNTPETVAKKIVKAIEHGKSVEMVNPLNWVGYYLDSVPLLGGVVRLIANQFLKE